MIRTRTCVFQRVGNVSFSKNFAYVLNEWFLSESLLVARLDHVVSLKSKWKSNWSYMKSETTLKWKYELKKKLNWLFDVFKARLGHSIGENYMKMKIWFDFFFQPKLFKIFRANLGHGIGEYLLMARLSHVVMVIRRTISKTGNTLNSFKSLIKLKAHLIWVKCS